MIANRPPQHRITGFEGIEDRPLRDRALDIDRHLAGDARQGPQMCRQHDSNHRSFLVSRISSLVKRREDSFFTLHASRFTLHRNVWTSTERTAGKSRTIGFQLSPPSADA